MIKHSSAANILKSILQWATLLAIVVMIVFFKTDPEKYCPAGGLQAFITWLVRGSLPCSMTTVQIVMGLAMAVAVVLFSKLFCGFLCPLGTVADLLPKLRFGAGRVEPGKVLDKALRLIKYVLLFWIFYSTATASELFCKNLDPYYAVATGFKGEITLWMSITSLVLLIVPGIFIDRFWCKYICPLGAASNTLKFYVPFAVLVGLYALLAAFGLNVPWWVLFGAVCIMGYLFEILSKGPKGQILHVVKDDSRCTGKCHSCQKSCPYAIDAASFSKVVNSVDCTLCGQCLAACPTQCLSIGVCKDKPKTHRGLWWLPAVLAVVITAFAIWIGGKWELPTINETWDIQDGMKLETVHMTGLRTVKCYGSSMAFKARMQKVPGVHGVKTYVGSHSVAIKYDPKVTDADKVQNAVFVPSKFRVWTPDLSQIDSVKVLTIRTEKMYDKLDLNYLGLQFRQTGRSIFGVSSEFACPLIVRVYCSPSEDLTSDWFKQIVSLKSLDMPVHGGGVKATPVDFKYVRLEPEVTYMDAKEYVQMMFDGFSASYNGRYSQADTTVVRKRSEVYAGSKQYIYEVADRAYEKPIIQRAMPYLSNHISREEGVIGMQLALNADYVPSIQIRYAAPMTEKRIRELLNAPVWTITYRDGTVKEESPRMKFPEEGVVYEAR